MLFEEDFDTWKVIFESVAGVPQELAELSSDMNTGIRAIIETGSLPGQISTRTDEFLEMLPRCAITPLLSLRRINVRDVPSVEEILASLCLFGIEGVASKRLKIAECVYLVLGKNDQSLFKCKEAEGLRDRLAARVMSTEAFVKVQNMSFEDCADGGTLGIYAVLIVRGCGDRESFGVLFRRTVKAVEQALARDPRSVDQKMIEQFFDAFTEGMGKPGFDECLADVLGLISAMLTIDVMDKRYVALTKLASLIKNAQVQDKVGEWFASTGIECVTALPFRDEFKDGLQTVYELLSLRGLIPRQVISELWERQKYMHVSDAPTFFQVFSRVISVIPDDAEDDYWQMITSPTEKCPEWVDFIGTVAEIVKQRNETRCILAKLKRLLLEYVFNDEMSKAQSFARKHFLEVVHCGITGDEAYRLVARLLDLGLTDFHIELIHKVSEAVKFMDEPMQTRMTSVLNETNVSTRQLGQMIISLVKKQGYRVSESFIEKLFQDGEKKELVVELVKGDIFEESFIENVLSSKNIGESHLGLLKAFIEARVDMKDGLKQVPFVGESLLWKMVSRKSDVHTKACDYFVRTICHNNFEHISSQAMISHFLGKWESLFKKHPDAQVQLITLLNTFVSYIEERMDMKGVVSSETHLTGRQRRRHQWVIIGEGIDVAIKMMLPIRCRVIIPMTKVSETTGMPLDSFRLLQRGNQLDPEDTLERNWFQWMDGGSELYVSLIPDAMRVRVQPPQTVAPSSVIPRTNVMFLLYTSMKDGCQEAMDLMLKLPVYPIVANFVNAAEKMTHVVWENILPGDSPLALRYWLTALKRPSIAQQLRHLGFIEYLTQLAMKETQTAIAQDILENINVLCNEEAAKTYGDALFDNLLRLAIANGVKRKEALATLTCDVLRKITSVITIEEPTKELTLLFATPERSAPEEHAATKEEKNEGSHNQGDTDADIEKLVKDAPNFAGFPLRNEEVAPCNNEEMISAEKMFDGKAVESRAHLLFNFIDILLFSDSSQIATAATRVVSSLNIPIAIIMAGIPRLTQTEARRYFEAVGGKITSYHEGLVKVLMESLKPDSKNLEFVIPMLGSLMKQKLLDDQQRNAVCDCLWHTFVRFDGDISNQNVSMDTVLPVMAYADKEKVMDFIKYLNEHQAPIHEYSMTNGIYSNTGISGLENLGNTCYLNATLQQFFHIKGLRNLIIAYRDTDTFLNELKSLFTRMRECSGIVQTTRRLCEQWINWDGTKLDVSQQQDAAEFIQMLLDKMTPIGPGELNRLFQGKMRMTMNGIDEPYTYEYEEPFTNLIVTVKEKILLTESLDLIHAPDFFTGRDQYYADALKRKINATRIAYISSLPDHLIVQLKRFEYNLAQGQRTKINSVFDFPCSLDLKTHCVTGVENTEFELTGAVIHSGSATFGHYYSFVTKNNCWYKCNDKTITQVSFDEMYKTASGRENAQTSACLLFYSRKGIREEDTAIVDEEIKKQISSFMDAARQSDIFCGKGLVEFYKTISKDGTEAEKEMTLRYLLSTYAHTKFESDMDDFLKNLEGMSGRENICCESDWLEALIRPESQHVKYDLCQLLSGMTFSDRLVERVREVIPKAFDQFTGTVCFWKILMSMEKESLQEFVPQLKLYVTERFNRYLLEKKRTKFDRPFVFDGIGYVLSLLKKAEVEQEFWLSRDILDVVLSGQPCVINDYVSAYESDIDFVKSYFAKNSLSLPFSGCLAVAFILLNEGALDYMHSLRWIFEKKPVTERSYAIGIREILRQDSKRPLRDLLDIWFKPMLVSKDIEVRRIMYDAGAALVPHVELAPDVSDRQSLTFLKDFAMRVDFQNDCRLVVQKIIEWMPEMSERLVLELPDIPNDKCLGEENFFLAQMLDLLWRCCRVASYKGSMEAVYDFMRKLKDHSQPYDPHVYYCTNILVDFEGPDELMLQMLQPMTSNMSREFYTRAVQAVKILLPALEKLPDIPEDKIKTFLSSFTFMDPSLTNEMQSIIRHFTNFLTEKYKDKVLSHLDENLEVFLKANPYAVTSVLEQCNTKRHIIQHLSNSLFPEGCDNVNTIIQGIIMANAGPLEDPTAFIQVLQRNDLEKKTMNMMWDVIESNSVNINITQLATSHGNLSRKARYVRNHTDMIPEAVQLLLVYSCNSYKALYESCDYLAQHAREVFTSEDYSNIILTDWLETKRRTSSKAPCLDWRQNTPYRRNLYVPGIVKYLKAISPSFTKIQLSQKLAWMEPLVRDTISTFSLLASDPPSAETWAQRCHDILPLVELLSPHYLNDLLRLKPLLADSPTTHALFEDAQRIL